MTIPNATLFTLWKVASDVGVVVAFALAVAETLADEAAADPET
jgi:hypothetical protein